MLNFYIHFRKAQSVKCPLNIRVISFMFCCLYVMILCCLSGCLYLCRYLFLSRISFFENDFSSFIFYAKLIWNFAQGWLIKTKMCNVTHCPLNFLATMKSCFFYSSFGLKDQLQGLTFNMRISRYEPVKPVKK